VKRKRAVFFGSLVIAGTAVLCFFAAKHAEAQIPEIPNEANPAMSAYNSGFLVQANGQTFYTNGYQQGTVADVEGGWAGDQDLYVLEDRYEYTHNIADFNLMNAALNSMLTSPSWSGNGGYITEDYEPAGVTPSNPCTANCPDGWDDDIGWTTALYARGYLYTGNQAYLTEAENGWNFVMEGRPGDSNGGGWNSEYGGITETNFDQGNCQVSNSNFAYAGVWLYEATGDATYLNGAEAIYAWERQYLVNTTGSTITNSQGTWLPWQVMGCTSDPQGDVSTYQNDNVFDNGGIIYAATELYRVTGNQQYYNDALNIINHVYGEYNPTANPPQPLSTDNPLSNTSNDNNQYMPQTYVFTRALSNFLTVASGWWSSPYATWELNNAQDAWNIRNSQDLMWDTWNQQTPVLNTPISGESEPGAMDVSSGDAIWQQFPPRTMNLAGTYEIQNVNSGLALNVSGGSTANGGEVIQYPFSSGQTNSLWTFVPTSGGYYHINNVNSGLVLNVSAGGAGGSGINGATIIEYAAQGMIPGNDQWMPVQNSDGTFSFYNLFSKQALDVPGASTASSTQLDQWFANGTEAQKFNLIQPSLNLSGTYEIQNADSGLAVNVSDASTANGAEIIQWPFSGGATNAEWRFISASPGYYRIQNVNSGLYLNVAGGSTAFGAPIVQWSTSGTNNDQWRVVQNSNGTYSFYNANSTDALDVPSASTTSGTQLDQYGENGTPAQQFNLISQVLTMVVP